jgi:hypothetical protein
MRRVSVVGIKRSDVVGDGGIAQRAVIFVVFVFIVIIIANAAAGGHHPWRLRKSEVRWLVVAPREMWTVSLLLPP